MVSTSAPPRRDRAQRLRPRAAGGPLSRLKEAAFHIVWPWQCPLCGRREAPQRPQRVCQQCAEALTFVLPESYCSSCGREYHHLALVDGRCPACWRSRMAFAGVAVGGRYEGPLRQAILCWKFGGQGRLSGLLIDLLEAAFLSADWAGQVDALVPIPQPWTRWFLRRFHPAGELAAGLSARTGRPVWPILRARPHRPQVSLSPAERRRNVRKVFRTISVKEIDSATVCLVDDVMTTGATLDAAAGALLAAGARAVYAVAVARAS